MDEAMRPEGRSGGLAEALGRQRNRLIRIRNRLVFAGRDIDFRVFHERPIVAIYPELGLVYNRIMKAGNSTLTAFLNDLSRGRAYDAIEAMKDDILRPGETTLMQAVRMRGYRSFTCVRNPHTRILSSFLHKVGSGEDPRYAAVPGFGERSPEGLARFLDWVGDGRLDDDTHWRPQRRLLFQPPERFDVVARIETVVEDMGRVLESVGRDPAAAAILASPHAIEVKAGNKLTAASSQADRYHTDATRAAVRRLYAEDFEAFGYPE